MDPNANLKELLERARYAVEAPGGAEDYSELHLAELLIALDGWLSAGGVLPTRWKVDALAVYHQHVKCGLQGKKCDCAVCTGDL